MKGLTLYNILSYILLPFAALFGLFSLLGLLMALANPAAFLGVFTMSATVIYIITSFTFLSKGIKQAKPCKASLKDWIKVNAFVGIAFATIILVQSIGLLANPQILKEGMQQTMNMAMFKNAPPTSFEMMLKMMKAFLEVMISFSIVLVVHISITFRLLKAYHYVFDKPE